MSRVHVQTNPLHIQAATDHAEPFMQVLTYRDRTVVQMRAVNARMRGFVLNDTETRHLIAALEASLVARAAMPPSAGETAIADLEAMLSRSGAPTKTKEENPS